MGFAEYHTEEGLNKKKLDKKFVARLMQQVTISSVAQNISLK
jgi:hypothetical protein